MELGDAESAISQYQKAASSRPNNFTSPIYLFKAGQALESIGEYEEAVEVYKSIEKEYPESQEGRDIAKYIARASSFVN
jgi:TolA-binding protein